MYQKPELFFLTLARKVFDGENVISVVADSFYENLQKYATQLDVLLVFGRKLGHLCQIVQV